jgi:hypothetical protein
MDKNLSNKIIWNAMDAYLFIFVSWLFLFNKTNENINNDFVKWHTKSALTIHLWFLITYIIFISNSLFSSINILWFWLNYLIVDVIFIILLIILIFWIYKAKNGLEFSISKNISISKKESILDIDWDWEITEKEKLTILLSFIPFIWFLRFAQYKENKIIQDWTRLSIVISLIISLFYIFWYNNLSNLLSLFFIILISFIWVNLFTRNELLQIKLPIIFSPQNTYTWLITLTNYFKNYFSNDNFKDFNSTYTETLNKIKLQKELDEKELLTKKGLKIHKFLIYIPIVNLIFLFIWNTKYSFHIKNGLIITLLILASLPLEYFWYLNLKLDLLLIFPILFWISYVWNTLSYRMPIIYDIYILLSKICSFLRFWTKKINEKRRETNEISLKVEETKNT